MLECAPLGDHVHKCQGLPVLTMVLQAEFCAVPSVLRPGKVHQAPQLHGLRAGQRALSTVALDLMMMSVFSRLLKFDCVAGRGVVLLSGGPKAGSGQQAAEPHSLLIEESTAAAASQS
jgi:hypothetical protein